MNWQHFRWNELWLPPERLPLSQWAEKNFYLSPEYAPRTGPLQLYGWQREILDSWTDPTVEKVILMCGTQLIKTLFMQTALAFTIKEDPGPALMLHPKDGDARAFSKDRLGPMIRDCECLRDRVSEARSRTGTNNIQQKSFPGGTLTLLSARVPGNVAGRTIRYLLCDEIDKYLVSAGKEGDAIDLGYKRTINFGTRRKIALSCSPTEDGRSRIGKAYDASDRRKPWVPCSKCGELQVLDWSQVQQGPPALYKCVQCGALWNDIDRVAACEKAVWRAERPFKGTAGFWISHLYSAHRRLEEIVAEYLDTKDDPNRYRVFINTTLAKLWEVQGETPDEEHLFARREEYPAGDQAVVPSRGLFLTCAVDVQENPPRLEYEVVAWGRDRENWSIDYGIVQAFADPEKKHPLPVTASEVWDGLDRVLQREYRHASGQTMPIMVMAIDTGKRPRPVYTFAVKHAQPVYTATGLHVVAARTVVPIKGTDDAYKVISRVSKEDAARKRQNVRIVSIGTHAVKQEIYDYLRHVKPADDGSPVRGCYHFPKLYEKSYFEGLCSEKRVVKDNGDVVWEKKAGIRNEPLDLKVYNRGAATIFGIDRVNCPWKKFEEALRPVGNQPAPATPAIRPTAADVRPARPVRFKFDV